LMEQSAVKENAAARKRWGVSGGPPDTTTRSAPPVIKKPDNSKKIKALQKQVDRLLKEIESLK